LAYLYIPGEDYKLVDTECLIVRQRQSIFWAIFVTTMRRGKNTEKERTKEGLLWN